MSLDFTGGLFGVDLKNEFMHEAMERVPRVGASAQSIKGESSGMPLFSQVVLRLKEKPRGRKWSKRRDSFITHNTRGSRTPTAIACPHERLTGAAYESDIDVPFLMHLAVVVMAGHPKPTSLSVSLSAVVADRAATLPPQRCSPSHFPQQA